MNQMYYKPNFLVSLFSIMICCLSVSSGMADEFIILDGLGGATGRYMQHHATHLECQGHQVVYRPWWAWRGAARAATGPVHVIGYSMGGSRAAMAARRVDAISLELIEPFRPIGAVVVPCGLDATVYRATGPSVIQSRRVIGPHQEFLVPANHLQAPRFITR